MAQVTSGPLPFPKRTVQALEEDEINPDSVLRGKLFRGRSALAWLTCGPHLEVVTSVTGERLSAYRFSGVNEEPPTVRVVKEFSWQRRPGLLVGLEAAEGSILCLYDLGLSRVVKAVVLPGRVTAIEPVTNHRGPSVSTRHLHQGLRRLFGVAAVATDVGHLLLVDLGLDDFSCRQNETEASGLEVVTSRIPAEVAQRRETVMREGRHLCFQLQNPSGTAISTLSYISRSNQLVVGFSDGCLSLWNMKTLRREHHSQLEGGRIPVHAVTFQEPKNDPRNCCYLWAVQSTQESEDGVVSLHLLQLAFGDRRRLASGQVMYEGLEYCGEKYSLDLTAGVFPLRGETSNPKLLSCQTVEKFPRHVGRQESVREVISPESSVAVFSWQVNTPGQGKPSAYLGVFDINRWYHAQMPDSLRPGEFLCDCPYFALCSLDAVVSTTSSNCILDVLVHERSLRPGVPPYYPPPEQFLIPSSYNFDGTCLLDCGVVHVTCSSFRKEVSFYCLFVAKVQRWTFSEFAVGPLSVSESIGCSSCPSTRTVTVASCQFHADGHVLAPPLGLENYHRLLLEHEEGRMEKMRNRCTSYSNFWFVCVFKTQVGHLVYVANAFIFPAESSGDASPQAIPSVSEQGSAEGQDGFDCRLWVLPSFQSSFRCATNTRMTVILAGEREQVPEIPHSTNTARSFPEVKGGWLKREPSLTVCRHRPSVESQGQSQRQQERNEPTHEIMCIREQLSSVTSFPKSEKYGKGMSREAASHDTIAAFGESFPVLIIYSGERLSSHDGKRRWVWALVLLLHVLQKPRSFSRLNPVHQNVPPLPPEQGAFRHKPITAWCTTKSFDGAEDKEVPSLQTSPQVTGDRAQLPGFPCRSIVHRRSRGSEFLREAFATHHTILHCCSRSEDCQRQRFSKPPPACKLAPYLRSSISCIPRVVFENLSLVSTNNLVGAAQKQRGWLLAEKQRWIQSMQEMWESWLEEAQKEWDHRRVTMAQANFPVRGFLTRSLNRANSTESIPLTENRDTDATDAAKALRTTSDYSLSNGNGYKMLIFKEKHIHTVALREVKLFCMGNRRHDYLNIQSCLDRHTQCAFRTHFLETKQLTLDYYSAITFTNLLNNSDGKQSVTCFWKFSSKGKLHKKKKQNASKHQLDNRAKTTYVHISAILHLRQKHIFVENRIYITIFASIHSLGETETLLEKSGIGMMFLRRGCDLGPASQDRYSGLEKPYVQPLGTYTGLVWGIILIMTQVVLHLSLTADIRSLVHKGTLDSTSSHWTDRSEFHKVKIGRDKRPLFQNNLSLSPLSVPSKILTTPEAVCRGLPRDIHTRAEQPAADDGRLCSLREQHYLEPLLYLMTSWLRSNGDMIHFPIFIFQIWVKLVNRIRSHFTKVTFQLVSGVQHSHIGWYRVKATASNDIYSLFRRFLVVFQLAPFSTQASTTASPKNLYYRRKEHHIYSRFQSCCHDPTSSSHTLIPSGCTGNIATGSFKQQVNRLLSQLDVHPSTTSKYFGPTQNSSPLQSVSHATRRRDNATNPPNPAAFQPQLRRHTPRWQVFRRLQHPSCAFGSVSKRYISPGRLLNFRSLAARFPGAAAATRRRPRQHRPHRRTHRAHAVEHQPGLTRHGGQRGRVAHIAQQHADLRPQRRIPCAPESAVTHTARRADGPSRPLPAAAPPSRGPAPVRPSALPLAPARGRPTGGAGTPAPRRPHRPGPGRCATRPVPSLSAARSSTACSFSRLRPATAQRGSPCSSPPAAARATSSTTNWPVKPEAPNTTSSARQRPVLPVLLGHAQASPLKAARKARPLRGGCGGWGLTAPAAPADPQPRPAEALNRCRGKLPLAFLRVQRVTFWNPYVTAAFGESFPALIIYSGERLSSHDGKRRWVWVLVLLLHVLQKPRSFSRLNPVHQNVPPLPPEQGAFHGLDPRAGLLVGKDQLGQRRNRPQRRLQEGEGVGAEREDGSLFTDVVEVASFCERLLRHTALDFLTLGCRVSLASPHFWHQHTILHCCSRSEDCQRQRFSKPPPACKLAPYLRSSISCIPRVVFENLSLVSTNNLVGAAQKQRGWLLAEKQRWIQSMQEMWESWLEEAQKEWDHRRVTMAQANFPVRGFLTRNFNLWSSEFDVFPLSCVRFVTHTPLCQQCPNKTLQGLSDMGNSRTDEAGSSLCASSGYHGRRAGFDRESTALQGSSACCGGLHTPGGRVADLNKSAWCLPSEPVTPGLALLLAERSVTSFLQVLSSAGSAERPLGHVAERGSASAALGPAARVTVSLAAVTGVWAHSAVSCSAEDSPSSTYCTDCFSCLSCQMEFERNSGDKLLLVWYCFTCVLERIFELYMSELDIQKLSGHGPGQLTFVLGGASIPVCYAGNVLLTTVSLYSEGYVCVFTHICSKRLRTRMMLYNVLLQSRKISNSGAPVADKSEYFFLVLYSACNLIYIYTYGLVEKGKEVCPIESGGSEWTACFLNVSKRSLGVAESTPSPRLFQRLMGLAQNFTIKLSLEEVSDEAVRFSGSTDLRTIYLLLDIMHSFPNRTDTSIDSFPAAFAIPWGFVKLIQGFWLLDHNDYENSLALLFHPATVKTVSWQHTRIIQSLMCQGEHRRALRYLQMMKPSASSSSEVRLLLTVLLSNRCMVEAWTLLQQHTTKLTIEELLKHMYETCQEMGLMEDLLKLPFADTEQECLEKFLQSSGNVQNQEFLVVHHLQRANYIPALQLNRSMKVNLTNDCDPRWRERAGARNFILDQYGKILPRGQRRLAEERAKPYHLPSSAISGVTRPKPLSTVTKQANTGNNVHTRATFISNVLSKIGEVWEGSEQKSGISRHDSPRAAAPPAATHPLPEAELRNAFVGTPVTTLSQKRSRSLGLVVCPVPSHSAVEAGRWQSPCRASTSFMASSPLRSNAPGSTSHKDSSGAAALTLLETPLVVKRAKVLATSAPGFPGFTTRSILRSSLRTTPPATPSASPGSVTPPLRAKEPRISFREENLNTEGTLGVTEEDKTLSGASSEHHHGVVEDAWSESRDEPTLFTLSSPEDECAETEEPSESIPGDGWEEMDVSKEKSNFSARSDQTTLEYNDARSPGDFEDDVIFIAAKPANASPEETASFEDSERTEDDSEVVEDQPFQVEQLDSSEPSKVAGVVEEPDAECLNALPEDGKLVFKAAEAAISGTASEESEANHQESKTSSSSEEKAVSVATDPELSESPEAGRESVTSALDSEDVASAHSEHGVEGKRLDFPKDATLGAAEVEEDLPFPQEELTVSSNLPEAEVVSVIEDSAVKAPTLEEAPETSLYSDLAPSGNFQHSSDTTEQQLAWDLPDHKDGECDAAEGEGELFISPSNFSLVWEGEEGEAEMGDAASVDASKPAGTTEEKPGENLGNTENQEHVTNSVSTVTSDQESQNTAESLPYVPEPIKVAIAENLLDVIKDTRSKEFTAEVVEQSIHETIGKKVTRFRKAKAPLTVPEGAEDEASQHQAEHVITPRTCTRGQLGRRLTPSAGRQQLLRADKPLPAGLSPRRSTRRMREASETEASAQGEQMPVLPVTPRRGGKLKAASAEKVASSHSDGQTLSVSTQPVAVTPRRGLRRAKEAASELLEGVNEETSLAEDSIIASATSRRTRGGKSSAGEQETGQTDTDRKVKTAVSPSRSARKLKSINLQLTENPVRDQGAQPSDQLLSPAPAKRGRRRKRGSSEVSENSDLDPSESLLPQTEFKLPVTPRRSARKATQNYLADTESLSTQEDINSGGRIEILGTPRRRITRVSHAEPAKTDAHEETRTEASTPPRTAVRTGRRGRKRRSILEESTGEEAFPPGPEGTPLLPKDTTPLGRDEAPRTSTDRVPRRSSRKTATHQKLSVEGKESFLFSPPLTKLTKKSDGKAEEPVQLKDLDPDLSSQFVFSPPLLRSRRKNVSSISQIVKEPELPTKGEEDSKSVESVGKQKSRRGRTAKSKMKKANKTTRKEGSWSPPPAEIKFISPFPSPVAGTKSKQKETAEAAEKNLRKNKRRLSNFPKPVVRRKML
ncbi:LOW QUALITY PROTEIN: protein ELYS-like [Rhynochetos jubatus]